MKPIKRGAMGTGIISVLTILLVLCLSEFAALTLASAQADLALSRRSAEAVSAWYAADAEAEALYAQFLAGSEPRLETVLPVTEHQNLELCFEREADGSVRIVRWSAAPDEVEEDRSSLRVWTGLA